MLFVFRGRHTKSILILLLLLGSIPTFIPTTSGVIINPGNYFTATGGLLNYTVSHTMNFSSITINPDNVTFNTTAIIPDDLPTHIIMDYIDHAPLTTTVSQLVLEYNYTWAGVSNTFNITGFKTNHLYNISKEGIPVPAWSNILSSSGGILSFTTTTIGTVNLKIYDINGTGPSVTTNTTTGTSSTNTTLWGYILDDGGANITTIGFNYGPTTSYGDTYTYTTNYSYDTPNDGYYSGLVYRDYGPFSKTYDGNWNYLSLIRFQPVCTGFCMWNYTVTKNVAGIKLAGNGGAPNGIKLTAIQCYSSGTWVTAWSGTSYIINGYFIRYINFSSIDNVNKIRVNMSLLNPGTAPSVYEFASYRAVGINSSFSYNLTGLSQGTLYHYQAFATNINGTGYGTDMTFLTKPEAPTGLTITNTGVDNTQLLSWTHGIGYNATVMRAKVDGSYPANPQSNTAIYNSTGTSTTVNNTFLLPGRLYYYRAWEYTPWGAIHQFSESNSSTIGLTKPYAPTDPLINITFPTANISWTKGDGVNTTKIVYKSTGYPTSPTDGTTVYNGTASYYHHTITNGTVYYFTAFSYTAYGTRHTYADNKTDFTNITGGGFIINCYDEESLANLTFNVLVTNPSGTDTYQNNSCNNPLLINSSLCPHGSQISIFVSAVNHRTRVYTMALFTGLIYTLNAYLPANESSDSGCTPQPYTDTRSINSTIKDYVIPLTYRLHTMIQVEVYNSTLGYWVTVPNDKYVNNSNQTVTIKSSVLNTHAWTITMGRVTYYYLYCPGEQLSYLYNLHVQETIYSGDYSYDSDLEGVNVVVKKYVNATSEFVTMSSMVTDASGMVNIYLIPSSTLYKIFLNKSGYYDSISDYIPAPPNEWGQTEIKLFKMIKIEGSIEDIEYSFWESCSLSGVLYENNTLSLNYYDSLCNTTNAAFFIYEEYNGTLMYLNTSSTINCVYNHWYTILNCSRMHKIISHINHTNLGWVNVTVNVNPWVNTTSPLNIRRWIEDRSTDIFGNFEPGIVNFFIIFFPCIFVLLIPGNKNLEFGIIMVGLFLGLISIKISIPSVLQALIPLIIFIGILYGILKHGKVKI